MMTLIVGGAASGKSGYGEALLARQKGVRVYLATMRPLGEEAAQRIQRHRASRRDSGFVTVECYVNLEQALIPPHSAVLLEDVGNLCANELFDREGGGVEALLRGVRHLADQASTLFLISNEVGAGGRNYAGDTDRYLRALGEVNRCLAREADNVCEVVCGIPNYLKGAEPN